MGYRLDKLRVLLVDDSRDMAKLTISILKELGCGLVDAVYSGDAAFDYIKRNNPDLILTDWKMADGDGIELTRKLRYDPGSPNPYIPIILITGYSERQRVLEARDAGVTEMLVKPFSVTALAARLVEIIERPRAFVRTRDFFGPDRRRKIDPSYQGVERRAQQNRPESEQPGSQRRA